MPSTCGHFFDFCPVGCTLTQNVCESARVESSQLGLLRREIEVQRRKPSPFTPQSRGGRMPPRTGPDTTYGDLETGRDAAARRAWPSAYDALSSADAAGDLEPEDLEILAKAAWWTGRPADSIDARERAYALYIQRGDERKAAFTALTLRRELITKGEGSLAAGWLKRAEELLEAELESVARRHRALTSAPKSLRDLRGNTNVAYCDRHRW